MDEAIHLEGYHPSVFERPSVTIDPILMSVVDGAPAVVPTRRDEAPFASR